MELRPAEAAMFEPHAEAFMQEPKRRWREAVGGVRERERRTGYLAVHGIEKSFGGRRVVKGASLYVRWGEAVGLLGPNGAGKTTVFYMITGLIKPDRGRIELDGYEITRLPMVAATGGSCSYDLASKHSTCLLGAAGRLIDVLPLTSSRAGSAHLTHQSDRGYAS
jgi:ABC-type glutathione transport system ATPase component